MIAMELAPHIYLANIDGSNLHRFNVPGEVRDPSFSPDGTQLVFSRFMRLSRRVDTPMAPLPRGEPIGPSPASPVASCGLVAHALQAASATWRGGFSRTLEVP